MMEISLIDVILIAISSAVVTLFVAYSVFTRVLLPQVREQVDKEFDEKLNIAVDLLSEEVRKSVKQGVLQAVAEIPSAEVLRETTQTIAKTGIDIMGVGLDVMRGRRR
jgi:hypothetical protein